MNGLEDHVKCFFVVSTSDDSEEFGKSQIEDARKFLYSMREEFPKDDHAMYAVLDF